MAEQRNTTTKANRSNDKQRSRASSPRAAPTRRPDARRVASTAAQQLEELIGKELEGVTGIGRTDDGWTIEIDVLELRRIPGTTDVLATYEVDVDTGGRLEGYRRVHRFMRGDTGEE